MRMFSYSQQHQGSSAQHKRMHRMSAAPCTLAECSESEKQLIFYSEKSERSSKIPAISYSLEALTLNY